ncbi:MAG: SAM-dependent methyltransferase [Carbonactinosporaceae bacterium]
MTNDWVPPRPINTSKPSSARIYDHLLGGKDNYAVDREAAEQMLKVFPQAREIAQANRRFLVRAVRYCAEQGIDQFVDIGTGFPTSPNVPEVAREIRPEARVVGVDNDPVVLSHHRALVTNDIGMATIEGDVRDPLRIIINPELNMVIDLNRPVAVLLVAILHFVRDEESPATVINRLMQHTAPGSYLVISSGTSDGSSDELLALAGKIYQNATAPVTFRPESQIRSWFDPFHLVAPGLVDVRDWRPDSEEPRTSQRIVGGVAYQTGWIDSYEKLSG